MTPLYQIRFTSESGDHYCGGYWDHPPTYEEVMTAMEGEGEKEYIEELVEEGSWSREFWDTTEILLTTKHPTVWLED